MKLTSIIDHTLLAADATSAQIARLCQEAREYSFASVCVNSCRVAQARTLLEGCPVKVCTVVGFPLGAMSTRAKADETRSAVEDGADEIDMVGAMSTRAKADETRSAVEDGADEIDMVINVGYVKDGDWDGVLDDIMAVREACKGKVLKVILETCLLTDDEIVKACRTAVRAGADFVKTSTGFSKGGATVHAVSLMRSTVGSDVGVKASGGIRDAESARAMVEAGASRLGCSAGVAIAKGESSDADY